MTEMRGPGVPSVPAAALDAMSQEDFEALVSTSLGRDAAPGVWDALTAPLVIHRTKNYLTGLRADVQNQVAAANAQLEEIRADCMKRGGEGKQEFFGARSAQADWRHRTAHFRRLVERRVAFVKAQLAAQNPKGPASAPGTGKVARKHNRAALETLARAVLAHRSRVESGDGDEGDDETLWAHLTSVTAITGSGEELPLNRWLGYLDDLREDDDA